MAGIQLIFCARCEAGSELFIKVTYVIEGAPRLINAGRLLDWGVRSSFDSCQMFPESLLSAGLSGATPSPVEDLGLSPKSPEAIVQGFMERTGFPDLAEVSRRIEANALQAINRFAAEFNFKILYSGYDGACSVARQRALPGSDIDHWVLLAEIPEPPQLTWAQSLVQWWKSEVEFEGSGAAL